MIIKPYLFLYAYYVFSTYFFSYYEYNQHFPLHKSLALEYFHKVNLFLNLSSVCLLER